MAVFVPVSNVAEVIHHQTQAGQKMMNTVYYLKDSAWDAASLQDLADTAFEDWSTQLPANQSNTLTYNGCKVYDLTTEFGLYAEHMEDEVGIQSGSALPTSTAFCIKFATAQRGRSFRGRIYLAGIPASAQENTDQISTVYANLLLNNVQEAIGGPALTLDLTHVVVSRYSGYTVDHKPAPRSTGIATPVTSISYVDRNLDVQRRRAAGRGQ